MKNLKKIFALASLTLCATFMLTACGSEWYGDNLGGGGTYSGTPVTTISNTNTEAISDVLGGISFASIDDTSSVPDDAVELNSTTLETYSVTDSDTYYEIGSSETAYVFTGSLSVSYSINIEGSCTIYLNNATITYDCEAEDLFKVTKNEDVTFVIVDETKNTINVNSSDSRAIYLRGKKKTNTNTYKNSLNIIGSGSLTINSTNDCIKSRGNLNVQNSSLVLTSTSGCALKGNTIALDNCSITATTADKDAIHAEIDNWDNLSSSTNDSAPTFSSAADLYAEGFVTCTNSTLTIVTTGSGDGIQADSFAYFSGNTISITTNGGAPSSITESSSSKADGKGIKVGPLDYTFDADTDSETTTDLDSDYYAIWIVSGTFNINSNDDAIHSNAEIYIEGGTITISTGDDAIHADNMLQITESESVATSITVTKCYEGVESQIVEIDGGTFDITSADDGINAADGTGNSSSSCYILITGGTISVSALGDGIDSNGNIFIYGGEVYVNGPATSDNVALDADGSILVYGGEIFAIGPKQMVETPSTSSSQCVISYSSNSTISAGTTISLKDSSGNTIISITSARSCQSLIISSASLVQGSTYTLYSGSSKLSSFTLSTSSIVTTIGSSGNDFSNMGQNPNRR